MLAVRVLQDAYVDYVSRRVGDEDFVKMSARMCKRASREHAFISVRRRSRNRTAKVWRLLTPRARATLAEWRPGLQRCAVQST